MPSSVRTVSIPFADLKERDRDLSGKIEEGLGPNGLGIISISDIPFLAHERTAAAAAGLALDAPSTSCAARQPNTESMESDGEEEAAARRLKGCPELTVEGDMREMAKTAAWSVSS
ncbi:hypothetical protein D1007_38478 [Hordeum vulgare]|nr:hypothetical protein D1007_38478 [Hordeum vulgare]